MFGSRTDTLTYSVTTNSLATALLEGTDWTDGSDNDSAALALANAIDGVAGVSAVETTDASGDLTITADAFGAGGNDIIIESDDATNLALDGGGVLQPLTGGAAGVQASLLVTVTFSGVATDTLTVTVPSAARIRNTAVAASGSFEVVSYNDTTDYTITVGSNVLTATTDFAVDTSNSDTASELRTAIGALTGFTATGSGTEVIVETDTAGTAGNSLAIVPSNTNAVTASAATLNGGVDNAVGFTATAGGPTLTATYTWTATATDVGDDSVLGTGSDDSVVATTDTVVVENTVPTVSTITVNDDSGNGDVDEVVIVFDGNMDDSTFTAADWSVGGQTPSAALKSSTPNDATWKFTMTGLTGTGVFDVTYTGTSAADIAGNLLATVATGDKTEIDNAVPVVKTIETGDADADGKIDRIVITASEALATGGSPDDGWTVAGFTITSGAISGSVLTLTITELGSADTSLKPDTTFDGSGDLKDLAATPLQMASVSGGDFTEIDKAPPVLLSAQTKTSTTIDATFSETVATAAAGDFSVAGSTVSGASASGPVVTIIVDAAFNTGATPLVTYTAGTLVDVAPAPNNALSGTATPTDGAKPSLLSVTWTDTDTSGTINATDTLKLVFSESMDETTVAAADIDTDLDSDFPTSGSGETYGTVANGTSILWTVSGTVLTITLGTDAANLAAGDTVDPLDSGVLDLAANQDNTTSPPAIVQVTLSLVPDVTTVVKNGNVVVAVEISNVLSFDAAVYTVQFNDKRFEFVSAAAGSIGGTPILVSASNTTTTTVLLSQNVSGNGGVGGSGTLAVLTFKYVGNSGENDTLIFASNSVTLSNANANAISANLVDAPAISSPALLGDANGDGSLGAADITAIERLVIGLTVSGVIDEPPGADANSTGGSLDALDVTKVEDLVINAP